MSWRIPDRRTPDPEILLQQDYVFCILNLIVIVSLLIANLLLSHVWGPVTPLLFVTLVLGFAAHFALTIWLPSLRAITTLSILINVVITLVASTTNRNDSQYYILMSVPVLQAAFRYSLRGTLSIVALANFLNFFWIWQYGRLHGGQVAADEYVEAGTISFIYTVTGIVSWIIVNNLRRKEAFLADSLDQLSRTRVLLLEEEKLAVIGRLSTSIADEIRNPVASIIRKVAVARQDGLVPSEQAALFDSVLSESARLEKLAADFLAFAQPAELHRSSINVAQTLRTIVAAAENRAASRHLKLSVTAAADLPAFLDQSQILLALTHLLHHAIDTSLPENSIYLRAMVVACN